MMPSHRGVLAAMNVIAALAALLLGVGPVRADHQPSNAVLTITDSPDPAASGGNIVYTLAGKNDGPVQSFDARLEAEMPVGAAFLSCRTTPIVPCNVAGAIVSAEFAVVKAHDTVRMTLTIKAPEVSVETTIRLPGQFTGENMHMDEHSQPTTILPPATRLLMIPSMRTVAISCGDTLDSATFGADTEGQVLDGLVCNNGSGLTMKASGKTLNLGDKKIVSSNRVTGNAAIIVGPNATNVTIKGNGTDGTKGIEQFDYCIKDQGNNPGLHITNLRCFRAKTAGILTLSDGVLIEDALIDNTISDSKIEAPPGGVGIQAGGDNIRVKDTIVRRSGTIGFWAYSADTDGSGLAAIYDGNTTSSRIENNFGIGALLSNGPHKIKGSNIQGDNAETGRSKEGIVVSGDARHSIIEEVVIKEHHGHGVHVEAGAIGTVIERSSVEQVGGSGYVVDAPSTLNGNSATGVLGDAFVINGAATLTSNSVEACPGNAFVINAPAVVDSNSAVGNDGYGFVVTSSSLGGTLSGWSIQGVGDFNGDGKADILLRHSSGVFYTWLMNGTAIIGSGSPSGAGADWTFRGLGDFNGDGKADILLQHSSGVVYIWLMNGTTIIGSGSPSGLSSDWTIQAVGDFNGDGKADLLLRHSSGILYIWLLNGTNIIGSGSPSGLGTDWTIQGVGDFNGDGKTDILLRHSSGIFYTWLLNGTNIIGSGSPSGAGSEWTFQAAGDFNGDGQDDILLRHSSGLPYIWLMNGTSIIGSGSPGSMSTDSSVQAVGDFNGDGMVDILWRHTAGLLSTWFMNGTNLFSASGSARLVSNHAERNTGGGFLVTGSGAILDSNTAKGSGGRGYDIAGSANVLDTNTAERNAGPEFVIGTNNIDEGSNRANGSRFSFTAAGGSFE